MELSPGDSSRAVHTSPPLTGDQTNILQNPAVRLPNVEIIRSIVREEILGKRSNCNLPPPRLPPDQTNKAQLCLVFLNEVRDRIYANDLVKADNGDPVKVAIKYTQSIRSPDRSLSSARVILTVLDANFWENKGETWSWSEFNQSVLSARNGKGPILIGPSLTIQLENGVGTFRNIVFNDNSSWSMGKFFRLGVKVDGEEGYLNGERVQEGVSKPFRVLDRKSKASQKPDLLKLTQHVHSLKKVGKERASLLQKNNIKTVEDFLKFYQNDEAALREILFIKSESDKGWMSMVEHAMRCADEFHAKCNASNNSSQPRQVREEIHVREEVGKRSRYNSPPPRLLSDPKIQARYQLQFTNKVKNTTFTTDLVRDENGHPIKVAIYDMYFKSIISPDNSLSSAKVKIIVLNAEFVEYKGETLSRGEFNQSVLRERKTKGPILTGRSCIIQLENGVGTFENIVFNDNSSWTKSGFRLGVMVESDGEEGYLNGERVQEGVSEPFRVRDCRGKAFQKPDHLKLTDKVQSLKKVGKGCASLLQKENIKTVEDFLKFYFTDEPALREILCIKSESGKKWDSMVEHAMQCANEYHAKYNDLNNSSQPRQVSKDKEVESLNPISNNINALVHPMEGHSAISSGSSEPNPSENDRIEGDVPAINRQHAGVVCIPEMNLSNKVEAQKCLTFIPNDGYAESLPSYNTQVPLGGGGYNRQSGNQNNYRPRIMIAVYCDDFHGNWCHQKCPHE